jgi:methionine-rich copper-binding protein CopC
MGSMKQIPALLGAVTFATLFGCGGGGGGGGGSPPTVVSTTPANGATSVALSAALTVTFSEAMDCSTITTATLGATFAGNSVAGTVACTGTQATFTPSAPLAPDANYTAAVQTGAKSGSGVALAALFSWSFTTSGVAGSAPTVVATLPAMSTTGVPVTSGLTVTFSEAMNCSTLTTATFGESVGGVSVAGTVACSGTQATFTPSASLSADTTYIAAVQAGVLSNTGLALTTTYTWSFITAASSNQCASGTDGGTIYVADFGNDRVVSMDDMCGDNWASLTELPGAGSNALGDAEDIFVASTGEIYVADTFNNRIIRMDDMSGTNWTALGGTAAGTGVNEFTTPRSVFVDSMGRIYVTDGFAFARIVRFDDMTGTNWTTFPANDSAPAFSSLWGLFVDATFHIYVVDNDGSNNTISRVVRMDDMSGTGATGLGTYGSGTNQFARPWGVSVDSSGRIYVADQSNQRIVRMDDISGTNWTTLGTIGTGTGQFFAPNGIYVDGAGHIYVADSGGQGEGYGADDRIVRMDDMDGTNWTTLGTLGIGVKEFTQPVSVWVH